MELKVTAVVTAHLEGDYPAFNCSGSVAEHGSNAGAITWNNSKECAESLGAEAPVQTPEQLAAARDYFRDYGAWDSEEIDAWTPQELNALIVQEVMGEIRRLEEHFDIDLEDFDPADFDAACENEGGRLFFSGNEWCFSIGL